jgi:hypothetical protein
MEHRVTLVEQLSRSRQPFPEMGVIYFIAPTKALVVKDFEYAAMAKYVIVHTVHNNIHVGLAGFGVTKNFCCNRLSPKLRNFNKL